jgi:hypothetical protein
VRRSVLSLLALPALLLGCASSGSGTGGGAAASASDSPRLTQEEIVAADLPTAYDLVDRLRRPWLRRDAVTGGDVVVYMDNRKIGGASSLREIPAVDVGELEYLPNDEAIRRWGSEITGSVIVVTRRR